MPIKKMQKINEDVSTFKRLNRILFDNWKDRSAQSFREGCTGKIEREWDSIYSESTQLLIQLQQIRDQLQYLNKQSKKY